MIVDWRTETCKRMAIALKRSRWVNLAVLDEVARERPRPHLENSDPANMPVESP